MEELRTIPTRLKAMVGEARAAVNGDRARQLHRDLDEVQAMAVELGNDLGRGSALFLSSDLGLREHVVLPAPVRDRLVVDPSPYLGPLQAIYDHFHRYAAVVVARRGASVYRFHMGELQSWEEIAADEPIRKDNYGGFAGYAEQRVRSHADEVAKRLFRTVAERVTDLHRTGAFDLLVVGGSRVSTASLIAELPRNVVAALAGTFSVDVHTATPSEIRDHCREVAAAYDHESDLAAVADLVDTALGGGRAALGTDAVRKAVNRGAVDRLLVAVDASEPGVVCPECGAVDLAPEWCELCGTQTRPIADLVDGIAERARATGASVRYILGDSPLADHGVGATLRFRV
jgi:peptide subunit release factor 1 (eRF1)